ncbi:MAG: zinc-finger domain-containing protein [Sphingopyxis sp.]|jgi:uncharacterized Zn-finger protein|nr:zinc-finger domain-containing protein [Sphingopyxis sp.]
MIDPPEITHTQTARISCMGASDVAGTALGHPRVWLQIDPAIGYVDCGYCDRRFVLSGGPADTADNARRKAAANAKR